MELGDFVQAETAVVTAANEGVNQGKVWTRVRRHGRATATMAFAAALLATLALLVSCDSGTTKAPPAKPERRASRGKVFGPRLAFTADTMWYCSMEAATSAPCRATPITGRT